MRRITAIKVTF